MKGYETLPCVYSSQGGPPQTVCLMHQEEEVFPVCPLRIQLSAHLCPQSPLFAHHQQDGGAFLQAQT